MQAPTLIAEIGCNHMGDLEIAKRFIEVAGSFCEVQNVKFQKRSNRDLLPPDQFDAPHPVPTNSFGDTYGVDISDGENDVLILASGVVIDMICHDNQKRH